MNKQKPTYHPQYRLLMLSGDSSVVAGSESTFYEMLEEYCRYWRHIDIICPRPLVVKKTSFFNGRVTFYPTGGPLWQQLIHLPTTVHVLVSRFRYDAVVSHDFGLFQNALAAAYVKWYQRIPWISELLHIEGYPIPLNWLEHLYFMIACVYIATLLKWANKIRCIHQKQVPGFLRSHGVPRHKILILPAGFVDYHRFVPNLQASKQSDLIFIGRLEIHKRPQKIIKALTRLRKYFPRITLTIVGQGTLKSDLEQLVAQKHLEKHVKMANFLPSREDLVHYLQRSRLLICASSVEGGPRVTIEAMACGIPVITTPVGIMPEVIADGVDGLFFDGTITDLVKKIKRVLNNPTLATQLGQQGRAKVVKLFAKKKLIRNYALTYHQLIENSKTL